ncbi:hypothetical protein SUDANB120_06202 (plasmid) [Streptomyces sp. enrichment culture]|uniref:hypothetical protein n=1 Tax=Streptomyces sp. enrichment culture TaxID=1795815 RepID=UPI003F562303
MSEPAAQLPASLPHPIRPLSGRHSLPADSGPERGGAAATAVARLSYEAFCARYRRLYARYAAARLHHADEGASVAEAALSCLARRWPEALACESPAAVGWKTVTGIVEASVRPGTRPAVRLPGRQADTVILRHRLGLSAETAAEVMGISWSEFSTLHQAALRTLSQDL